MQNKLMAKEVSFACMSPLDPEQLSKSTFFCSQLVILQIYLELASHSVSHKLRSHCFVTALFTF